MELNRKDFLKLSVPVMGLLFIGRVPILNQGFIKFSPTLSIKGASKAVLYDPSQCRGCRACETACRHWNKLQPEHKPLELSTTSWTVIKSLDLNNNGKKEQLLLKRQCMHCTQASCEAVCPTGAITHQREAVIVDQEWCIGCGYCVQACPFDVPFKCEEKGTIQKCILCTDRTAQGLKPACVEACPAGAVIYGDRDELIAEGERRVQALSANGNPDSRLYGATELGGLGVMYILLMPASAYNLPEVPRQATTNVFAKWASGIITAGMLAVAPFWLFFKRSQRIEDGQRSSIEEDAK
ncbi:4Fe-4S dicluster domain-containing protein [Chloroflexota bacterium]